MPVRQRSRILRCMRRATALRLLAPAHVKVLTLSDQGLHGAELAERLGLDEQAVDPLLRVARSKLAALEALDEPASQDAGE
jgi:DNA-directed RNA polymerase specialized sigma24 family protein